MMGRRPSLALLAGALLLPTVAFAPSIAVAQERTLTTRAGTLKVETIAKDLEHPWAIVFLPDGDMLVSERPGRLRRVGRDGKMSEAITGVPEVYARGQGGLLGLALDPKFRENQRIYMAYAEAGPGGASTAVARGRLDGAALRDVQVIFRQDPKVDGGNHFGARLIFARDGTLFITTGERFKFDPAQDLMSHLGKVIRINPDGTVPKDNPFVGRSNARPEIWSYGHRNIQGAALHPETGALWIAEMGPRGGDEINVPEKGKNYGWPLVSWGDHYDGRTIPKPSTRSDLAGSIFQWTPSIAPSGMVFYTADANPGWKGSVLVGALAGQSIVRLTLGAGAEIKDEERIAVGARIRDLAQGPDGALYALTDEDDGKILRLSLQKP
jgi:aldose sugar dehydrogenase